MNRPDDRHDDDLHPDEHGPRRRRQHPLGPLLVTFRTRLEAEQVGAYELARIFASLPLTSPIPPKDASSSVHELAVVAGLASICSGLVGLHIHGAVEAGVPVDEVAAAAGLDRQETERTWRSWADGQLSVDVAGLPLLAQAAYDRVARRFTEEQA